METRQTENNGCGREIELIHKYLRHTVNEEEEMQLLEWLESSEDNPRYMAEMMTNLSLHDSVTDASLQEDCDDMCRRLNARIDAEENEPSVRRRRRTGRFIVAFSSFVAAASLAALLVVTGHRRSSVEIEPAAPVLAYRAANTTSSVQTCILADNTKVFLKPGSEIRYDVTGMDDGRIVELKGEAYFDVARDTLRPFVVKTSNISVKVLGTAFTVKALLGDPDTEVVLERGKVRILSPEGVNLVDLRPDQSAKYSSADRVVNVESCYARAYVAGHFNLVSMENATIAEIVESLEEVFSAEIKVGGVKRPDESYYFSYLKTDSLQDILSVLEFITGAQCEITH